MGKKAIILLVIPLLLIGCWDKVEIEERAHISAVGIDKYEFSSNNNDGKNNYIFTFAFPEHKKEGAKDIVLSTIGETLYSVSKIMADRSDREFFLGHLRTVIIGADIAKNPVAFRQILDGIENNELLSRRVTFAMTEDSAKEIVNVVPTMDNMLGEFVSQLFRRKDKVARTVGRSIGDILKDLHENGNTIVAKIIPGEADVKVAGAAVIGNYEFKGWLDEVDAAYLQVLKGETKRLGGMSVQHREHTTPLDIKIQKSKFRLIRDENNIKILIEIKMEGDVKQTYFEAKENMLDPKTIGKVKQLVKEDIEQKSKSAIHAVQKEFETDVLGIDKYLRQSHHRLWRELEKDWHTIFPNIDIDVEVDIEIRRIGLVR